MDTRRRRCRRLSALVLGLGADAQRNTALLSSQQSATVEEPRQGRLTPDQQREFVREGFIVVKGAVSKQLTAAARRAVNIEAGRKGWRAAYARLARHTAMTSLITGSRLTPLLTETMGPFVPPTVCQPTIIYPVARPSNKRSPLSGVPVSKTPFFGVDLHLDGLWTPSGKNTPQPQPHEIDGDGNPYDRPKFFGADDENVFDSAGTPLWQDPARRLSVGSFTAFVGIALNDQLSEGCGQLNLLGGGAHEAMAAFYRRQRAFGGVIGPEGPGWPRFQQIPGDCDDEEETVGITFLPPAVRQQFAARAGTEHAAGMAWLRPTPISLAEGDAVIALQNVPHSSSVNVNGAHVAARSRGGGGGGGGGGDTVPRSSS